MKKVVTVLGARPQFVKAGAVSRIILETEGIEEVILHTGQHFDHNMSDIFFEEMQIPKPRYNLDIHSVGHGAMTGRMLEGIEEILKTEKPDVLMVYGDTNSTIAGALAAKKLHIKVAHVEAGLRSFNIKMPEEVNRILTDRISDVLFCPTTTAIKNLKNEGYENLDCTIDLCGDVMQDAAMFYSQVSAEKTKLDKELLESDYVLVTIHRAENTDDPERLKNILEALNEINKTHKIILPIHPRTRNIIANSGLSLDFDPIDPVGYFDMIELLKGTSLVLTDSGGLQKEAYFFDKYCVTMRDETEWTELIEAGVNKIVGADKDLILEAFNDKVGQTVSIQADLYGGGSASTRIVEHLLKL